MGKYYTVNFMCDKETEMIIKELQEKLGDSRSKIIRDAVRLYYSVLCGDEGGGD